MLGKAHHACDDWIAVAMLAATGITHAKQIGHRLRYLCNQAKASHAKLVVNEKADHKHHEDANYSNDTVTLGRNESQAHRNIKEVRHDHEHHARHYQAEQ
ncbi:MAG: hypothetical protein ACK5X3_03075 [Pseudomonadota bacterium]